jgi:hypothetical protein
VELVKKSSIEWNIYRTRFLVKAKQLTQPMSFIDSLGREHSGRAGDYLVEWSDGSRRVAPRQIFEDVYVVMDSAQEAWSPSETEISPPVRRRVANRTHATV